MGGKDCDWGVVVTLGNWVLVVTMPGKLQDDRRRRVISNPADHYMYGSCNRLEKATHNRAKIQELTGFDMRISARKAGLRVPDNEAWHPQGQCHLNKKNLPKAGAFEGEAGVPELFAVEGTEGAFDHARIKAQTPGRQQCRRLTQIQQQALLKQGKLLTCDESELITGRLQNLQGMGETELVRVQLALQGRLVHPPAHRVVRKE